MAHSAGAIEYTEGQYSFNECPGYDTKQSDGESPIILENAEDPFIAIPPRCTLAGVVASDRVLSIDQIEPNSVLRPNGIV